MPNRILKECITTDERFGKVSFLAELVFYHLLVVCDDYGRADGRTDALRARLFPFRLHQISEQDFEKALDELVAVGLVQRYSVRGQLIVAITNWSEHQIVRAKKSRYPGPECADAEQDANLPQRTPARTAPKTRPRRGKPLPTPSFADVLFQPADPAEDHGPVNRMLSAPGDSSEESSALERPRRRKEDPIFEALVEAIYGKPYTDVALTQYERGKLNRAVAQLRAVQATPEEILRRAALYRMHFPNTALTPTALVTHWNLCAHPPTVRSQAQIRAEQTMRRALDAIEWARQNDAEERRGAL